MGFALSPHAVSAGYRLESFRTVGSTNALGLERARAGDDGRLWLVSSHQQSGRGRRGRPWSTQPGNLAATLLLVPDFELARAATLGFVAGLALAEALESVVPARVGVGVDGGKTAAGGRFELKWPNDLVADGAKLSGILLESAMLDGPRYALAIGIGVNIVSHPVDTPYPATSLTAMGAEADAETLFLALSDAWVANCAVWNEGRGTDEIRRRWLARAAGLGSQVAINVEGRVARGVFETIDEDLRFVIREAAGGTIRVAAGDVHFGAVASAGAA